MLCASTLSLESALSHRTVLGTSWKRGERCEQPGPDGIPCVRMPAKLRTSWMHRAFRNKEKAAARGMASPDLTLDTHEAAQRDHANPQQLAIAVSQIVQYQLH